MTYSNIDNVKEWFSQSVSARDYGPSFTAPYGWTFQRKESLHREDGPVDSGTQQSWRYLYGQRFTIETYNTMYYHRALYQLMRSRHE
jgi:hypothetical protein